ncbi:MAG TPA: tripartite tricarboxylate transporter substrate binding protein [bacterium]|nr:tripartite tricarboxylate transporter substrate binding protein [bacterium]
MKWNRLLVVAIVLFAGLVMFAGCVDKGTQGDLSEEEIAEMVAAYPAKDIHFICPPKQGGLSDFITRTLGFFTEDELGAKIIVENRPGAAGATGMRFGAAADPDGTTVTYVTVESTILKHRKDIQETVSYKDFDLIARLNYGPASLAVNVNSPIKTFDEFVKYAKENEGKVNVGNSGQYSIWHLASAVMADSLGITIGFVPYDGAAPSVQDLLGGHLDAVVASPSEVFTFVKAGQLRLLTIFGEERDPEFADVPTARELGYDIVVGAWGGIGVPVGTPDGIKQKIYDSFKAGFDKPGFREKCKERSVSLGWQDMETFKAFAAKQDEIFGKVLGTLSME